MRACIRGEQHNLPAHLAVALTTEGIWLDVGGADPSLIVQALIEAVPHMQRYHDSAGILILLMAQAIKRDPKIDPELRELALRKFHTALAKRMGAFDWFNNPTMDATAAANQMSGHIRNNVSVGDGGAFDRWLDVRQVLGGRRSLRPWRYKAISTYRLRPL